MVDVKALYEPYGENYGWYDYEPMIEAFGNAVVVVSDNYYQGDTRVLYDNNGKIGHLIFGWGSCSGCDALQACFDYEELQELCNKLENDIKWFANAKEALCWFENRDWALQWEWNEDETKEYIQKAIEYLSEMVGEG